MYLGMTTQLITNMKLCGGGVELKGRVNLFPSLYFQGEKHHLKTGTGLRLFWKENYPSLTD